MITHISDLPAASLTKFNTSKLIDWPAVLLFYPSEGIAHFIQVKGRKGLKNALFRHSGRSEVFYSMRAIKLYYENCTVEYVKKAIINQLITEIE